MAVTLEAHCASCQTRCFRNKGFTLIELSIVLVIIGLIIGGVLVGQDLISAAATRAQITQIEKYNSAVNTFRNKYNGIPGDIQLQQATQFGFTVGQYCIGQQGGRDGNGLIDADASPYLYAVPVGETGAFWQDLSAAGFMDAAFPAQGAAFSIDCVAPPPVTLTPTPGANYIGNYLPTGKIGYGSFVLVYDANGTNWFGLSTIASIDTSPIVHSTGGLPVSIAFAIDQKIDDGIPTTGNVTAVLLAGSNTHTSPASNATPDSSTTCYNSTTNTYSTQINNGSSPNCALSFKMQGAAR